MFAMVVDLQRPADEIRRLQRCVNDLVSVLALPAIWSGGEPSQIMPTLLDALIGMLRLDLACARLNDPAGEAPRETVRLARAPGPMPDPQEVRDLFGDLLGDWLGDDPQEWPPQVRRPLGGGDIGMVPMPLGLQGEIGVIVAGSRRPDFPVQTERLLLSVAANQASIGLQGARLLSEQRRLAGELDRRVAQRTAELSAMNVELRREIAERRAVEARLRQEERGLKRSEAFLAEAQHLSSTGSFSWRPSTDEITWSDELQRIFELGPPLTPAHVRTRVHPEDVASFDRAIERARASADDFELGHRLLMPDGSVRHLRVVARATRGEDGELEYIAAVQDVTESRQAEEALSQAQAELAHVARVTSLGVLTASIAHEVAQPLSGIRTNAGTCLRMLAADPPNIDGARETARRTIRDGQRASEVIMRLRALFDRRAATAEPVDLNATAREVVALSWGELQRGRVVLQAELADDLPPVTGDRIQLQQVILNLLLNAADAMSTVDDRPRRLLLRTERDGDDRVRLSAQDVGVGFDPRDADRLFEAFYTTKHDGMGIGLSVSRSIIESLQGRLWATPNDGPGATFAFSVPRAPDAQPPPSRP